MTNYETRSLSSERCQALLLNLEAEEKATIRRSLTDWAIFLRLPTNKFFQIPPDLSPVSILLALLFSLLQARCASLLPEVGRKETEGVGRIVIARWSGSMSVRLRCRLGLSLNRHRCDVRCSEASRSSGQADAFQDVASADTLIVGHGALPRGQQIVYCGSTAEHKGEALSTGYACPQDMRAHIRWEPEPLWSAQTLLKRRAVRNWQVTGL